MRKVQFIITIFIIFGTSLVFAGQVYYIDGQNGDDLNSGTSLASAWKSMAKANSELQAGDTVYIRGGTYDETISPANSGTPGNYISYQNYQSEEVIITNVSQAIYLDNKQYIKIKGLKIENVGRFLVITNSSKYNIISDCHLEGASDWGGARIEYSSHNKILNNYIYNGHGDLVELYPDADYNLIEGNEISGGPLNTHSCLVIRSSSNQDPSSFNIIRNNYIHGGANDNVNILQKAEYNIIEDNIIEDTPGAGLKFCGGKHNIFRRNIIINCRSFGFGIYTNLYSGYQSSGINNKFYNNLAYKSGSGENMDAGCRLVVYAGGGEIKNNVFKNNIFLENSRSQVYIDADPGYKDKVSGNIFKNNLLFSGAAGDLLIKYKGTKYSLTQIESLQGSGFSDNLEADPDFLNPQNKNFHLKSSSPCINTGGFLTKTTSSGSGNQIPVEDAGYFTDGFSLTEGDTIQLEGQSQTAKIKSINYNSNILIVDKSLNWYSGQGVSFTYSSSAPDIGVFEYEAVIDSLNININASETSGYTPFTVNFTSTVNGGAPPYSYNWDFGDGSSSSDENPSYTFSTSGTYTVTLTVTDSASSKTSDSIIITAISPSSPLSASAGASTTSGEAPLTVNFTGSASGGTSPFSFSWDFGDGSTSSYQNPSHTFNSSGTYTIILTVTDSNKNSATDSLTITATSPPAALSASASASTTSGEAPLTVNFTGSASGGTLSYSYSWDFGDSQSSSEQNPTHTFSSAGAYTVTLTVTDSNSSTATDSLTITVTSPPAAEANLSISSLTGTPAPGSGGTTDPSPGNHSYAVGSSVEVKAEANTNYRFAKWSGDVNDSDLYKTQIAIIMDKDKSISAHFYTKCGDVNGDLTITPADAQDAFDIFLGKIANPTESELENADVNCDGTKTSPNVTPADAQAIFEQFLGKSNLPCSCSAASRASTLSGRIEEASNINLIINDIEATKGQEIVVPIIVDDCFHLKSFGFDLIFPGDTLEFVGVEREKSSEAFDKLDANLIAEGVVRAGGYKRVAFSEHKPQVLINLVFRMIGKTKKPISLTIVNTVDDIRNAPVIKEKYIKETNGSSHVR